MKSGSDDMLLHPRILHPPSKWLLNTTCTSLTVGGEGEGEGEGEGDSEGAHAGEGEGGREGDSELLMVSGLVSC